VLAERGDRINGAGDPPAARDARAAPRPVEAAAAELAAAFGEGRETKSELLLLHGLIVAVELIALERSARPRSRCSSSRSAHPAAEASLRAEADEHRGALAARVRKRCRAVAGGLGPRASRRLHRRRRAHGIETLRRAIRGGALATTTRAA
jgi:hypothetical protein